jgi:hypothetical protein
MSNLLKSTPVSRAYLLGVVVLSTCLINAKPTMAQELTVQEWVDQFVTSCVGSGSSDVASGQVGANGDISLKRLTLSGTVKGDVQITHKEARLLTDGINNAMSAVAASEADSLRQCLAPLRTILAQIMTSQFRGSVTDTIYILTPEEDAIIKALAIERGKFGKTGEAVLDRVIQSDTRLGDIRYDAAMRRLENKGYAYEGPDLGDGKTATLMPDGEDYAIKVGFAQ